MNAINWTTRAARQLRKLDTNIQKSIVNSVGDLSSMPDCQRVKKLVNHEYQYRLRIGDYRVLFDWDGEIKIVEIQEVRKRNERTY